MMAGWRRTTGEELVLLGNWSHRRIKTTTIIIIKTIIIIIIIIITYSLTYFIEQSHS
jgi:hypothetical protein